MVSSSKAFECFIGAWGFLNATLVNTTTHALIPEWHGIYPSGLATYTPDGYNAFIITANDTTQPEYRPRNLTLPASASDPVHLWATVAQHSLAAAGPFQLSKITIDTGKKKTGPSGVLTVNTVTATLPSWVGVELVNEFKFYDGCKVHSLKASFGDAVQTLYFHKLPNNRPS